MPMALGKRKPRQEELFIPRANLVTGPGHPFYSKLNEVLATTGFDEFVEKLCAPYFYDRSTSMVFGTPRPAPSYDATWAKRKTVALYDASVVRPPLRREPTPKGQPSSDN